MFSLFISHQWVGRQSADPSGLQLDILREALRHVISGKGKLQSDAVFFLIFRRVLELSVEESQKLEEGYIWLGPQRCRNSERTWMLQRESPGFNWLPIVGYRLPRMLLPKRPSCTVVASPVC